MGRGRGGGVGEGAEGTGARGIGRGIGRRSAWLSSGGSLCTAIWYLRYSSYSSCTNLEGEVVISSVLLLPLLRAWGCP